MSSYVCPICRDLLAEPVEIAAGKTREDYHMVAAFCGHMFHRECLIVWMESQANDKVPSTCPVCSKGVKEGDIVKLFPQSDEKFLDYTALVKQVNKRSQDVTDAQHELQAATVDLRVLTEISYQRQKRITEQSKQLCDLKTQIENLQKEEDLRKTERKSTKDEFEKLKRKYEEYKSILEKQTKAAETAEVLRAALTQAVNVLQSTNEENKEEESTEERKLSNANEILNNIGVMLTHHTTMGNESIPELRTLFNQDDLPRIILPKVIFGIPSGSGAKDLAAAYVQVIKSSKNIRARSEVIVYFPRGDIFFPSLEIFQLQMMTFLRIFGIAHKREVVHTDEDELPVMKIAEHVVYEPELCCEILMNLFKIDTKSQHKNPFKIDTRMINLWNMFSTRIIWALLLWQWAHDNGKSVGIVPEWTARVAAAVETKVRYTACQETYGNLTDHTVNETVVEDIEALSRLLGTENYFNGAQPAEIDCAAFVLLTQILWNSPNSEFRDEVRKHLNLINFVIRMKERCWPEWEFGSPLPRLWI